MGEKELSRIMLLAEPSEDKSSDCTLKIAANGEKSKNSAEDMGKENNEEVDSTVITTVAQIHYCPLPDTTSRHERNDESTVKSLCLPSSITCGSNDIEQDVIVSNTLKRVNNSKFVDRKMIPLFTSTPIRGHHGHRFMKCKTKEIDFDKISVYREPRKKKNLRNLSTKTNRINYGIKKMTKRVKLLAKSSSSAPKSSFSMTMRSKLNVPEDVKSSEEPVGKKNKQVPAISSSANDPESEIVIRRSRRKINPPKWRVHMKDCASRSSSKIEYDGKSTLETVKKFNKKDNKNTSIPRKTISATQKEPLPNEVHPLVEKDKRLPINEEVGKESTEEKSNKKDKTPSTAKPLSSQKEPLSDEVDPLVEKDKRLPVNGTVVIEEICQKRPKSTEGESKRNHFAVFGKAKGEEEVLQKRPKLPERETNLRHKKQEVIEEVLPEKRAKLSEAETKTVTVGSKSEGFKCSRRTRIKPLKYWIGERLIFKTGLDSCRELVGIELEQSIEKNAINHAALKRKKTTITSKQQKEESCKERNFRKAPIKKKETGFPLSTATNLQKRELIMVPYEGRDCKIECFSTLRSETNATEVTRSDVAVFSGIENQGMEAGFLQIVPGGEIIDSAHHGSVVFHVLCGLCTATINGKSKRMKKGDIIFVPKDLEYKILNKNFETVLSYTRFDTK